MDTTSMVSFALAAVFAVLYVMRRRARLAREDQD
jgi:hypothetical protein